VARRAQPAEPRLDLPLFALQHLEVRQLEDPGDDLRIGRLRLQPVDPRPPLRPAGEPLGVVEVEVGEDHVLDVGCAHPELLERSDHRGALHDQAGIHEVVALAANEQGVGECDHPGRAPAALELLVAAKAVGGVVERRYVRPAA
jgi:hypothetical protein